MWFCAFLEYFFWKCGIDRYISHFFFVLLWDPTDPISFHGLFPFIYLKCTRQRSVCMPFPNLWGKLIKTKQYDLKKSWGKTGFLTNIRNQNDYNNLRVLNQNVISKVSVRRHCALLCNYSSYSLLGGNSVPSNLWCPKTTPESRVVVLVSSRGSAIFFTRNKSILKLS